MLSHFLYVVNLCLCLNLSLFMFTYVIYFSFSASFSLPFINHITSFKQTYFFFLHFLENILLLLDDKMNEENEYFPNKKVQHMGTA